MQAVRIPELPPLQAACSGPLTTPERFEAFSAWFSAYHARLKAELYPRYFMWYNERLGANEWFYVLPEEADPADTGGFEVVDLPCGLYAVASCLDADRDQAADWLETHAFLRQWAVSSARFMPYENGPGRPERYPLFHIVSPGSLQAEGVSIEGLYDPIQARSCPLPMPQGGKNMSRYDAVWDFVQAQPGDSLTLTFAEIEAIAGFPLDHAFLTYKKELRPHGWQVDRLSLKGQTVRFSRLAALMLLPPEARYAAQVMDYRREMLARGDSLDGCAGLEDCARYDEWADFERRLKARYGAGYVPSEVFLAVRPQDDRLIGLLDFRHPLSDFLLRYGGNIGYSVRPDERRKGYATQMLRLALPICRARGETRVLVTCDRANEASRRVILANGGVLENEVPDLSGLGTGVIQRYWIDL